MLPLRSVRKTKVGWGGTERETWFSHSEDEDGGSAKAAARH